MTLVKVVLPERQGGRGGRPERASHGTGEGWPRAHAGGGGLAAAPIPRVFSGR
jgi:hypothetical protein